MEISLSHLFAIIEDHNSEGVQEAVIPSHPEALLLSDKLSVGKYSKSTVDILHSMNNMQDVCTTEMFIP